jgi:hypothetical protein
VGIEDVGAVADTSVVGALPAAIAPWSSAAVGWVGRFDRVMGLLPVALTAGFLGLLVVRLPGLIAWLNTDADATGAYVLAEAVGHGTTATVAMSTQSAWLSLAYGVLTRGLPFHGLLWEISPLLLAWTAAGVIGVTVARVAGRLAGALSVVLVVAAGPVGLTCLATPWMHNATFPAVALAGAWLVWLHEEPRATRALVASTATVAVGLGMAASSDGLAFSEALFPLLACGVLGVGRAPRRTIIGPLVAVTGACLTAVASSTALRSAGLRTVAPPLHLALSLVPRHIVWLIAGLLRLGNGISVVPGPAAMAPVTTVASGVVVAGLIVVAVAFVRALRRLRTRRSTSPEAAHVAFWSFALIGAAIPYVLTAEVVSDRYILIALPAVAAIVPVLLSRNQVARRLVLGGVSITTTASLLALVPVATGYGFPHATTVRPAARIAAIVTAHRLGVGYAGYWSATPLDWALGRPQLVAPVTDVSGRVRASSIAQIAAWYRPRPQTSSFLLLAPGDENLHDRLPRGWPLPAHEYHVGTITIAAYRFDIARLIGPPQ